MKRQFTFILALLSVLVLSSCAGMHYEEMAYSINEYQVYKYDHRFSEMNCDRITSFGLFVRDGDLDYITNIDFGECQNTLYIKEGGTFYTLSEAVANEYFTLDDVLDVDWQFAVYETHDLLDYTEIDNFVFLNESSTVDFADYVGDYVDEEIERVLAISGSVYQKFIIDYLPTNLTPIGYIDVYNDEILVVRLNVFEEGIFDPTNDSFQESNTSEIHGIFKAVMTE